MQKKSIIFIVNPISGGKNKKAILDYINEYFTQSSKWDFEILATKYKGHGGELASKYRDKVNVICAIGGDGTVNEIANELELSKTKLAIIPVGSGNGLARELNIPLDFKKAIVKIEEGNSKTIDLIKLENRVAVNAFGVGFDSHISSVFEKSKKRGLFNYAYLSLREYFSFSKINYKIELENKTFQGKAMLLGVLNNAQWGNNFYISPNSKLNDGVLQLVIVKSSNVFAMTLLAFAMILKITHLLPFIDIIDIKEKVKVTSDLKSYHIDGESLKSSSNEFDIEILKSALTVVV